MSTHGAAGRILSTAECMLRELAALMDERLPAVPQDDPYRSVLEALAAAVPRPPGPMLSPEQAEGEWRGAWRIIADACEAGLTTLHPLHPRRPELLVAMGHARRAAGSADASALRLVRPEPEAT